MSATIYQQQQATPRKLTLLWLAPLQAASVFTVWAISAGGQTLRAWILTALFWLMTMPLLVSVESTLVAMMLFEPFRGLLRRAQYLLVDYTTQEPIHLLTPIVTMMAMSVLVRKEGLNIFRATPLAGLVSLLGLLCFLEIFNPLQGGLAVGLSGALFLLVPLAWFYFGQAASERFIRLALRLIVLLGILASLHGLYQMVIGYPAFEQYWIDNTDSMLRLPSETFAAPWLHLAALRNGDAIFRWARSWHSVFGAAAKRHAPRIGWFVCGAASTGAVLLSGQRTRSLDLCWASWPWCYSARGICAAPLARLAIMVLAVVLVARARQGSHRR